MKICLSLRIYISYIQHTSHKYLYGFLQHYFSTKLTPWIKIMERILHKRRREYYQAHGLRTGQCCEIQEIFSELWEYVLYAKKLTLFFMCEFVKIIIVSMIHKASKDLFICIFVIKMTTLNCTKRFSPWEFYFLDRQRPI